MTEQTTPRLDPRARRALATGVAIVVTGATPGFLAASLAPRIRDSFEFGDSALGIAAAVYYVVSMALSTVLGRLVGRVGDSAGIYISAAATVLACLAIAALAESALVLTLLLALAGVGNAMASPAVTTMLKREIAVARQGLAFGAQQAGASLGSLAAGLALPLIAIPLGWRWAYLGVAVLAVVAAAAAPRGEPSGRRVPQGRPPAGLTVIHALALAALLASAAGVGFISFVVIYAVGNGLSESAAGWLLGGVSACAVAGRIVLGLQADRGGQDALRPLAAMFALSAVAYGLLMVGEPVLIVFAALLAGGFGWTWPGALNLAVVQRCPEAPAWAVGLMMAGLFAGAIAGPLAVGVLAEHDLFAAAWVLCAGCALLASATIAAVRRREAG